MNQEPRGPVKKVEINQETGEVVRKEHVRYPGCEKPNIHESMNGVLLCWCDHCKHMRTLDSLKPRKVVPMNSKLTTKRFEQMANVEDDLIIPKPDKRTIEDMFLEGMHTEKGFMIDIKKRMNQINNINGPYENEESAMAVEGFEAHSGPSDWNF